MKPTEPVFPLTYKYLTKEGKQTDVFYGIDLRTYLAGQAMQGLLARAPFNVTDTDLIAGLSLKYADALIVELNKEQK